MPKCLLEIGGRCLIDHQMELLRDVPDVRVVVGFKEFDVIRHVRAQWPDVTFVRNPDYAHTSNTHSLFLASRYFTDPYIALDGDLLINPASFQAFLERCASSPGAIVGVSGRTTEEAIGVELDARQQVVRFVRGSEERYRLTQYEWCGIAYITGFRLSTHEKYVFEELARHLPLPSHEIECSEIDTPGDLEKALAAFDRYSRSRSSAANSPKPVAG